MKLSGSTSYTLDEDRSISLSRRFMAVWLVFLMPHTSSAHDLWVETNVALVRRDEAVEVAFKLGNCDHGMLTFRTSGLVDKAGTSTFEIQPNGKRILLSKELVKSDDAGGYWHTVRELKEPGVTWFCQTLDQVIEHGGKRMRGLVSAKSFVMASEEAIPSELRLDTNLGFPLELVLESSPFPTIDAALPVRIKLLLNGQPLADETVSFLPKAFDPKQTPVAQFERTTDAQGMAAFPAGKPGHYLICARHVIPNQDPNGPPDAYYSTSLTLRVFKHKHTVKP